MKNNPTKEQEYLHEMKTHNAKPISNYSDTIIEKEPFDLIWHHLRQLRNVNRLSGIPLIQQYTVAEHCYYTGLLFQYFAKKEHIKVKEENIQWIYIHDLFESVTGDLLYPAKNYNKTTKAMWKKLEIAMTRPGEQYDYLRWYLDYTAKERFNSKEWNLFKAVDLYELYLFCEEEIKLGNSTNEISIIRNNCITILQNCGISSFKEMMTDD